MRAFNHFVMQSQRKVPKLRENSHETPPSLQTGMNRPFLVPQSLPAAVTEVSNMDADNGDFRCKSCGRGPPLTKKYAKNQCQTCYKKEKKY